MDEFTKYKVRKIVRLNPGVDVRKLVMVIRIARGDKTMFGFRRFISSKLATSQATVKQIT